MSQLKIFKSAKLHAGQHRIKNEVINSNAFFSTIVCPRQWGKSVLLYNFMLFYGINNKNWYCVWATLTHQHAQDALRKIYDAIKDTGLVEEYNKTERRLKLINGSVLYFTGLEKYENFRSKSTHLLIIDEAAFASEGAFNVLLPSLATTGRKVIMVSTPRGQHGEFYKYHQLGLTDHKMYSSHRGLLIENPFRNRELIEAERLSKPEYIFRQEYLGEFLTSEFTLFKNLDKVNKIHSWQVYTSGDSYYGGIDVGRANDFTCLTILNQKKEVVYVYRDRQKTYESMIEHMVTKLREYDAHCLIEVNSVGDVVYELMNKQYNKIYPFYTSAKSKPEIIEKLIVQFENQKILIPNKKFFAPLETELEQFQFFYNAKSRSVTYSAPQGLHDDTVISLALANECYTNNKMDFAINIL
jgi:phage FluMu gp28-like protein